MQNQPDQTNNWNKYREALENIVIHSLSRLIDLPVDEIDEGVTRMLQNVGEFSGDDRCYAIVFSEDGTIHESIYEWCNEGIEPATYRIEGLPTESLPWFTHKIKNHEVVQITDIEELLPEAKLEYAECKKQQIQSMLLVPMIFRGKPVGLLGFDAVRRQKSWREDEIVLLKAIAEILISTLQRKRSEEELREAYQSLEKRVEERTRELERRSRVGEATRDILRVLNSNRELPEVLDYIVSQACKLLKASSTMIRRADLENQLATTEASYHLPPEFAAIQRTRMYYSASDLILMSRRPVVIPDLHATYGPILKMSDTLDEVQLAYIHAMLENFHSMLSVPLFIKNEIFGSLTFYFSEPRDFPEDDIQLAMSLGDQAALAIENTRLYREEHIRREEAERRRQVAEGLRDILTVLNSHRPLDDILQQIVSQAVMLLQSDAVAIYRLWRKEGVLVIRASHGMSETYVNQIRIPVGKGIAGHVILSRKPVAVSDSLSAANMVGDANLLQEELAALEQLVENYRAFLSVPLIGKDEIYGAITLYYREARTFSQEEIELAVAFADQASLAIENTRLRSESEQNAVLMERNRLARDLHDAVTQTLFSASLIAEVLPRLWEKNPEEGRRRLEELRHLSRGALAEMRTLLLELRPAALMDAKLSDLLRQLAEAVSGRSRLPISIQVEGEFPLEPDVQVAFYRIAQEALNNVVKHSGAKNAWMSLKYSGTAIEGKTKQVELVIGDDGHGFDPSLIPPNHLGVGIMRERAQSIEASFVINSEIGKGTKISVLWAG